MSTQRRNRSAVACQNCRRRKVRCSISMTGVPCVGCAQDNAECIVQQRQDLKRKRNQSTTRRRLPRAVVEVDRPMATDQPVAELSNIPQSQSPASIEQGFNTPAMYDSLGEQSNRAGGNSEFHSVAERHHNLDEEQLGAKISSAALGKGEQADGVPFYTGEAPGFSSILDVCSPSQQPVARHLLISSEVSISLSIQDREYLQYKGVFTLPQRSTCNELLRAYFHHVHPIIPIVDATVLLKFHQTGKTSEWNLLLLWSMFFVAVNFINTQTCTLEGYSSRKEMKLAMYSRAKSIYDNGGETDKIVLLQSALLMGFWYSEKDSYTQPWYWTGVAISLCQMLGLHRDPDSVKFNSAFPYHRRHLWRRLWWSCFFRDRWLSLTLGRPLRINLNDCNAPVPSVDDVLSDLAEIPAEITDDYIPKDLPQLAAYWVILVRLSKLLGDVLTLSYQPFGPNPILQQVEILEKNILELQIPSQCGNEQSRLAVFYLYHLQLHYHALLITFYYPFINKTPEDLPLANKEAWQISIRSKLDSAALHANTIIDNIVREKLLGFAAPMTPSLLVSAMHIHLLNCKSADGLSRRLSLHKLELCMMVMEELEETYASASIYRGVFLEAIRQLYPNYPASADARNSSLPRANPQDDSIIQPTINDDVLGALLDEASSFNIWDSFGDIQLGLLESTL